MTDADRDFFDALAADYPVPGNRQCVASSDSGPRADICGSDACSRLTTRGSVPLCDVCVSYATRKVEGRRAPIVRVVPGHLVELVA